MHIHAIPLRLITLQKPLAGSTAKPLIFYELTHYTFAIISGFWGRNAVTNMNAQVIHILSTHELL
jgi:hypothetical protein